MLVTVDSSTLWYLLRGSGFVALAMMTLIVMLGVLTSLNWRPPFLPRFVVQSIHRSVSLTALVFLIIHVVSSVFDVYVDVRLVDLFVPFVSHWKPLWIGLGAISVDLLLALITTSLLRSHVGARMWKAIHWVSYLCWPTAVLHAFGSGTDSQLPWVLLLYAIEVLLFVGAIVTRTTLQKSRDEIAERVLASAR